MTLSYNDSASVRAQALGLALRFSHALEHEVLYRVKWPLTALALSLASSRVPGIVGAIIDESRNTITCSTDKTDKRRGVKAQT